jgi:hypothetical protein
MEQILSLLVPVCDPIGDVVDSYWHEHSTRGSFYLKTLLIAQYIRMIIAWTCFTIVTSIVVYKATRKPIPHTVPRYYHLMWFDVDHAKNGIHVFLRALQALLHFRHRGVLHDAWRYIRRGPDAAKSAQPLVRFAAFAQVAFSSSA